MARPAVAQETIRALRRKIARIEDVLPERLDDPADSGAGPAVVLRRNGRLHAGEGLLATGVPTLDDALGGGIPKAALTEIHGHQSRDAGVVSGFALALTSILLKQAPPSPILWIATSGLLAEAGLPYAHGFSQLFGIAPQHLLLAEAPKPVDALWIAEEAAALKTLAAVVIELSGNPQRLDLTATRRLHRRAAAAGRPVFLLRQSAEAETTAAPLRFIVAPAAAGTRHVFGRPLSGSIGPPAFAVTLDKNRMASSARFVLEWNSDERTLEHRDARRHDGTQDSVALVSLSRHRADMAAAAGSRMAYGMLRFPAAARQSS